MSLYYLRKAREEKKTYHSEVSKLSFMDILRKDAEDDARVAREQREMLLKYEREQAAREPKMGVATAAQVVSSLQRLRSPPPPSSPPSPNSFPTTAIALHAGLLKICVK